MKKTIAFFLALWMGLSMAACGGQRGDRPEETTAGRPVSGSENSESHVGSQPPAGDPGDGTQSDGELASGVLVAYFSATGTTEGVAETIAECLGAALYEITPVDPYTAADLDYRDDDSRSTVEMNDPDARPAIAGEGVEMEDYDIIFLGYPIWWGEAPRILSTFVESYDLAGKTIVPFCTSGGSGVGSSADRLEQLTSGAEWLEGKRLGGGASVDTVTEWINGLGLPVTVR